MSICDPILKAESNHRLKNKTETKNEKRANSSQEKSSSLLQGTLKCKLTCACITARMNVCVWSSPNPSSIPELDQGSEIRENRQLGKCQPKIKKCFLCKPRIPNEI